MKIKSAGHPLAGIGKSVTTALQHVPAHAQHEISHVAPRPATSPAPVRTVVAKAIERVVGKPAASPAHTTSSASQAKVAPRVAARNAAQKVLGTSSTQFLRGFAHVSQAVATSAHRVLDGKAVTTLGTVADKLSKPLDGIDASATVASALRSSRFVSTAKGQAWTGLQHLERRVSGGLHYNQGTLGLIGKGAQVVAGPLSLAAGATGTRDGWHDLKNAKSSGARFDAGLKMIGGAADVAAGAVTIAGCLGVAACSTPVALVAAGVLGAVSLGTEGVKDIHTAIRTHDLDTGAQGALEVAAAVGLGAIAVAL